MRITWRLTLLHPCAFKVATSPIIYTIHTHAYTEAATQPLPSPELGGLLSHAKQNHQSWIIRLPPESNPDKMRLSITTEPGEMSGQIPPNYHLSTRRTAPNWWQTEAVTYLFKHHCIAVKAKHIGDGSSILDLFMICNDSRVFNWM